MVCYYETLEQLKKKEKLKYFWTPASVSSKQLLLYMRILTIVYGLISSKKNQKAKIKLLAILF